MTSLDQSQVILEEARDRLQAGAEVEEVKAWAKTQAAAMSGSPSQVRLD